MTRTQYVARRWCALLGLTATVAFVFAMTAPTPGGRPGAVLLALVAYVLAAAAGHLSHQGPRGRVSC